MSKLPQPRIPDAIPYHEPGTPKKQIQHRGVAIAVVGVLVLAIVGGGGYLAYQKHHAAQQKATLRGYVSRANELELIEYNANLEVRKARLTFDPVKVFDAEHNSRWLSAAEHAELDELRKRIAQMKIDGITPD